MNTARRAARGAGALLGLSASLVAWAQQGTQAPVSASAGTSTFAGILQMTVALAVVLALIAAFAWLMRRMTQGRNFGGDLVRVRGGVMLGPKERAVLLEVADTWIIVGVGGGQISALHAMPRPAGVADAVSSAPDGRNFSAWLQQTLRDKAANPK